MQYMAIGSGCPLTCVEPESTVNCTLEPREGCFCKEGFVMSDNACVERSECGCKDDNGDYFPVYFYQFISNKCYNVLIVIYVYTS